jgi:ankyrin repeat protein
VQLLAQLLDLHPQLVHAEDENGWTPLHAAVSNLREDTVKLLVERGADVHARTKFGDSVLKIASHFVREVAGPEYQYQPSSHPMIQYLLVQLEGKELTEL